MMDPRDYIDADEGGPNEEPPKYECAVCEKQIKADYLDESRCEQCRKIVCSQHWIAEDEMNWCSQECLAQHRAEMAALDATEPNWKLQRCECCFETMRTSPKRLCVRCEELLVVVTRIERVGVMA